MKNIVIAALALAACLGPAAPAQAQALLNARNPETVRAQFEAWGYRPTALENLEGVPSFSATIENLVTNIAFSGCTNGRDCNSLLLLATYSDVLNPPYEWLNARTYEYDLVAAMRGEDGLMILRSTVMVGPDGIPASTLRAAIDQWLAANDDVSRDAIAAGLNHE